MRTLAPGRVSSLRTLDLARNRLRALPAVLGALQLGLLDASGNEISTVAPELGNCTTLRRLVLDGNPLRTIRQSLLTGPTMDLLAHLRSRITTEEATTHDPARDGVGSFAPMVPPAALAAATAARVAAEGGAARLDLRGRGLGSVPKDVWDLAGPNIAFIDLGNNELGGDDAVPSDAIEVGAGNPGARERRSLGKRFVVVSRRALWD